MLEDESSKNHTQFAGWHECGPVTLRVKEDEKTKYIDLQQGRPTARKAQYVQEVEKQFLSV